MDNLKIAAGKTTPGVSFESRKGELSIVGESYPENSVEFFKPLLDWLDEYLENKFENFDLCQLSNFCCL